MPSKRLLPVMLIVLLSALPSGASAGQLVTNGDFASGLSGWRTTSRVVKVIADPKGDKTPGSVKFELKGGRLHGSGALSQEIPVKLKPGEKMLVSFSWRKNWQGVSPNEHSLTAQIVQPDGNAVEIWSDKTISSTNTWNYTTVEITGKINQEGKHSIRLSGSLENGGGVNASTEGWFDDLTFNTPGRATQPKTSIISPTGASTPAGRSLPVVGMVESEVPVAGVKLSFRRAEDGLYWNGSSWGSAESWVEARLNKKAKRSSWSYGWPLPTSNGGPFVLTAKAFDSAGNVEWPVSVTLKVDTVAPSGSLFINDAASFTRVRKVKVDSQVTGATRMRFSTNAGRSWSKWARYSQLVELVLPIGDGNKILTGEFSDNVGNVYKISDTIVLDTTPPVTKITFPSPGSTKVKSAATIGAVFYEEMNVPSLRNDGTEAGSTFFIKQGSAWVPGSVIYDPTAKTAKFIPETPLADGTTYSAYLTGVEDAAGNRLAADYSWSFTTVGSSKLSLSSKVTKTSGGKIADGGGVIELVVQPESVASDTRVTVNEIKDTEAPKLTGLTRFAGIYKIGPANLRLAKAGLLKVKYQATDGIDESTVQIYVYDEAGQAWKPLSTRVDVTANRAGTNIDKPLLLTVAAPADGESPKSAIFSPTGSSVLGGKQSTILGTAVDDVSVSKVELAIVRLKDGYYWNGNTWSPTEAWIAARMVNGKGSKGATWNYTWSLPPSDGQSYRVLVRSIDGSGNKEEGPSTVTIQMASK